jgi:4-amino-4-deoxy-L-arabinose transferase-like glycosyltransferase
VDNTAEKASWLSAFLVFAMLATMAFLAGGSVRDESPGIDELPHTAAGLSYWQKLDMRMNEEHPPLSKLLAGLSLALRGTHADYSHISWTFSGAKLFNQYLGEWAFGYWTVMRWNNPQFTIWWARFPMLLLTLALGYLLYALGSRLGGRWGGLLCLACYVTTPAFLAFGPLVITDVIIALFWILTVWLMPRLWRSPSRKDLLLFGLAFAGALLSKFSSGLLLFVFAGIAISMRLRPLPEQPAEKLARRKWRRRAWWNFAKGTAWALLFVYVVYFVFSWHQPTDTFSVIPHFPSSLLLRRLLMPPWIYLRGLAGFAVSALSRPTYLLGHSYEHGVWFYFPVIFALKSQLSFLLLLLLGIGTAMFARRSKVNATGAPLIPTRVSFEWRSLWISLLVYVLACMLNRLDISVRHFLLAIALIILLLAPLPHVLQSLRTRYPQAAFAGMVLTVALTIISFVSLVRAYPYYLPYINSLSMGKPGYLLVNDSNLDWDQAFPQVEEFARQRSLTTVLFDSYGFTGPDTFSPHARAWNCQAPDAADAGQWAIVSGNNMADARNCLWLTAYEPVPLAGGSIYAFHLPSVIPPAGQPGGPPLPDQMHYFFSPKGLKVDIREVFAKAVQQPEELDQTFKYFMELGQEMQKQKH